MSGAGGARQGILSLVVKDKAALYNAYMPYIRHGGIFVPTLREYRLGDEVYVLITLPGDEQRYPVLGSVAWVTPARALGGRTQGVGVHFPGDEKSAQLRRRIEESLSAPSAAERSTQTI